MPKTTKITYTTPESVEMIMTRYGSTTGILNTDNGLMIDGKTYPKGTVFEVGKGVVREWKKRESCETLLKRAGKKTVLPPIDCDAPAKRPGEYLVGYQVAQGLLSYTGDPDLLAAIDGPVGVVEIKKMSDK